MSLRDPAALGALRDHDFRLLWAGETTSTIGSAVTRTALPIVAISVLHAGALATALLSAAAWAPWLLFGVFSGAIVDRRRRRPVMLWSDLVSIVLFASVPIANWMGVLTLTQLFVVASGAGVAAVFFSTAYAAYLPHVLAPANRDDGNAKIFGSAAAANLVGPGLAGTLAQAFGAAAAVLADAASFAVSAACLLRIRTTEPPPTPHPHRPLRRDIGDGVRFVIHNRYLRALTLWGGLANFSFTMSQSVLVLFLLRTVGVGPATTGFLLAAGSAGGIVGAFTAGTISRHLGTGYGLLVCELATAPFGLLIPLTHQGPALSLVIAGTLVPAAGVAAGNVIQRSFTQNYCPSPMLGRLSATQNVFNYGTMPFGALLAGALGATIGVRDALWISTATLVAVGTVLLVSPVRAHRNLPASTTTEVRSTRVDSR